MATKSYYNVTVTSAHSVRAIRVCAQCHGLGSRDFMLRIHWPSRGSAEKDKVFVHGRCFIKTHGIKRLIDLPQRETDKLTLGDIGGKAARALLESRESKD